MPSNCDIMWSFKNSSDVFDTAEIAKRDRGNSPAPKGHYVLNAFSQDRSTVSGLTITTTTSDYDRASAVAFFAGRVFYSGVNHTGFNATIYFSQIVERNSQFGQCYQVNDPTSEDAFDLLPADGGVLVIREAGNIIKMVSVSAGLLVFASNGVWLLSGSTGVGFTASDYNVSKISNVRTLTAASFVEVNGSVAWWTLEGIYTLSFAQTGPTVQSLTEAKIKSFYNDIPPSSKRRATGVYNPITGIIQWLYKSTESGDIQSLYEATDILNLNTNTGAFYPWTASSPDVAIHAIVVVENLGGDITIETVTDGGVTVTDSTVPVTAATINDGIVIPKFKYVVSYPYSGSYKFTFAEERDTTYTDYVSYDTVGVDYTSYITTGYKVHGEGNKKFQSNFVTVLSGNETPTQYQFQGLWDYANTGNSGRWSSQQYVTHTDTKYDYAARRLKVRGSGKALQFKVTSVTGEPFDLAGWTTFETGNTKP